MNQYERVFNDIDKNGDGKISAAELHQCVKAIGLEVPLVEVEMVVVEGLDRDGDGLLGLEDLIRLVEDVEDDDKMKDLKEAFKMYEMEGLQDCKMMIAHFDLNGDGVLDFDEFRLMML
ncbi:hypothetical protein V6Z11_A07G262800 [Gossypium hirsutum]